MMPMVGRKKEYVTKGRDVVFDECDEIAFVRILREKYPNIKFTDTKRHYDQNITAHDWPCECNGSRVKAFVPDFDNWKPLILPLGSKGEHYLHTPRRNFTFKRSMWYDWSRWEKKWAFDSPFIEGGEISGAYKKGDEETRLFLNTVWRLSTKITVNLGSWCGYSAIEWAAGGARRKMSGIYPAPEDWKFPEDCPYYRDELWDDNPPAFKLVGDQMIPARTQDR